MIQRVPICPPITKANFNNNNLHEYDPYILKDDKIIIDTNWFESLTPYIQDLIKMELNDDYILDKIIIPHEIQKDNDAKMLNAVYQSYLDGFDYNIWHNSNLNPDVKMIKIKPEIKQILSKMFKNGIHNDLIDFKNEINKHIITGQPYFIKLSSTSGKNENSITKLYDADQIIKHLTSNKLFVFQEYDRDKETYLIIIPWNKNIKPKNEFRLFVVNNKLTGASIQRWYDERIQHTSEELEAFEEALLNIDFLNAFRYKDFILDVYIDVKTKKCHLIEVNPFGAHCGAGSSLFNWITDYDILHGLCGNVIELRYLSSINY
jgi:hypothetical protein